MKVAKLQREKRPFEISYEILGEGPKKVLLVMGYMTDAGVWDYQSKFFGTLTDYKVCRFDNRGTIGSSCPRGRYTTSMMAEDALALVDYLGWKQFHLVGLSMGGMISTELALLAPERILSLSLLSTHAGAWLVSSPPLEGLLRCIAAFFLPPSICPRLACGNAIRLLYSQKTLETRWDEFYDFHLPRVKERFHTPLSGIFGQTSAISTHFVREDRLLKLKYSGIPVNLLVGTEDVLVKTENTHELQRVLGCPLQVVEGGHMLVTETPRAVNQALHKHIEQVEASLPQDLDRQAAIQVMMEARPHKRQLQILDKHCTHRSSCTGVVLKALFSGTCTGVLLRLALITPATLFWQRYKGGVPDIASAYSRSALLEMIKKAYSAATFRALLRAIQCIRQQRRAIAASKQDKEALPPSECPSLSIPLVILTAALCASAANTILGYIRARRGK